MTIPAPAPECADAALLRRAAVRVEEAAHQLDGVSIDQARRLRGIAAVARGLADFAAEYGRTLELIAVESERAADIAEQQATLATSTTSLAASAGWLAGPAGDAGGET